MRFPRPSPAMVVALIALVFATTGSAVAAVSYARNAGSVDRVSAVRANARESVAAGKLVATARGGRDRAKIPARFIGGLEGKLNGSGSSFRISQRLPVQDNANGAPTAAAPVIPGIGQINVNCNDVNPTAGRENPRTVVTLINSSGQTVDFVRTIGDNQPQVSGLATGTQLAAPIDGSTRLQLLVQQPGSTATIEIGVRQDGLNTADASCLVFGQVLQTS